MPAAEPCPEPWQGDSPIKIEQMAKEKQDLIEFQFRYGPIKTFYA
ncbi:MAG: hypothetical protein RML72_08845 [Bacteroidia bacterium]|nr:hypothetical protein [Bacteroidia bacterium]